MANPSLPSSLADEAGSGALSTAAYGASNRFAGGKTTESTTVEAEGSTTLATPSSGNRPTLYWIGLWAAEGNSAEVKVEVKVGSQTPYTVFLGKGLAFAHWELVRGAVNDKITVKLSAAQKVAVSFTWTEGA